MSYQPKPIDLSHIQLSSQLESDIEYISKNIHETWALQRLQEGWGYGTISDDEKKLHPCMVEYEALPEIEKDVDRSTVTQTIKMLMHLGYHIHK